MTTTGDPLAHLVVTRSERLRIRTKHSSDARFDYQWRTDPDLARYDGREPLSEPFAQFAARLESELQFQHPRERMYAIDTAEGRHIGNLMYYNARHTRDEAEFGITIGRKDLHGRGYGREATTLFLRYVWETTPFRLLVLHTLDWNERAARCFRAAGFEDAGVVAAPGGRQLLRMEARREWWLFYDSLGRFAGRQSGTASTRERP
jgi:RimJ/RimL family protein N-acetyltransferase